VHVVAPEASLADVGRGELPVLPRLVEALHEASLLLLARDVQKEFKDDRPLPREVVLEVRDVGEPLIPDSLADAPRRQPLPPEEFQVHAHDQDLLVVRTVEDADAPALGPALDVAPQEVVVEDFPRGLLEREHLASLLIDT